MSITGERGGQNRPASGVERALLTDGRGTSDDFPDPFGKHDMEWWVWDGGLLIPATDGNVYANEEYERSQVALRRLAATERVGETT